MCSKQCPFKGLHFIHPSSIYVCCMLYVYVNVCTIWKPFRIIFHIILLPQYNSKWQWPKRSIILSVLCTSNTEHQSLETRTSIEWLLFFPSPKASNWQCIARMAILNCVYVVAFKMNGHVIIVLNEIANTSVWPSSPIRTDCGWRFSVPAFDSISFLFTYFRMKFSNVLTNYIFFLLSYQQQLHFRHWKNGASARNGLRRPMYLVS